MAVSNILKKKVGRELVEWVFLGIRTGARRGVEEAERLMILGDNDSAILQLKRVIDLPNRAIARIDYFISLHGINILQDGLALYGGVTLVELNAELAILENYCRNLKDRKDGGESWISIVEDIKSNVEFESLKWVFPFPPDYVDIWGE